MKISVILKNTPDKDGLDLVLFRIHLNGKPFKISSGIKTPPEFFQSGSIISKNFKKGELLNSLLQAKKSILVNIKNKAELDGIELTPKFIRDQYNQKVKRQTPDSPKKESPYLSFSDFVDLFIEKHKDKLAHNYLRQFRQPQQKILEFKPDIEWQDFTEDFWLDYVSYVVKDIKDENGDIIKEGLKNITIHGHLKKLHRIMKWAMRKGYPVPPEFMDLTYKCEEKQPFWCTWEEVQLIKTARVFTRAEEIIRDSFFVSANLGIRNSDFNMINEHSIVMNNGKPLLKMVVVKTQLDYTIPINADVWEILQKYDLNIPKYDQYTFNRYIKNIVGRIKSIRNKEYRTVDYSGSRRIERIVPRKDMFTSHTARRAFGRRWLDMGGSLVILQKIFGHKSPETTLKYIGYSSFEIEQEFMKVMG